MDALTPQTRVDATVADTSAPAGMATLTRSMAAGDEAAYRTFYEAYFHRLFRYLLVVAAGDEDAAREALSAAFVRVVRHVKAFDDEAQFWNWLTVVARSALADQRRKRNRYLAFLSRLTEHTRTETIAAEDGRADARLLATLERTVRALPPDERELVERKYFDREAVREIAGALQVSEKAVESQLGRVRRKLKDAMLTALKHEPTD